MTAELPAAPEPWLMGPSTQATRKVIQWRYLFAGAFHLSPVIVVATAGNANDWAAYIAGVPLDWTAPEDPQDLSAQMVASWGCKLTEDQASGFFPALSAGRTYRR